MDAAGITEGSYDSLPQEVKDRIDDLESSPRRRPGIELKAISDIQVFEWEDERLRLRLPVPTVDVFDAFLGEMEKLENGDVREIKRRLARALWLLACYKPPIRIFPKWEYPKVNTSKALAYLKQTVTYDQVALHSLTTALLELTNFVTKKKPASQVNTAG